MLGYITLGLSEIYRLLSVLDIVQSYSRHIIILIVASHMGGGPRVVVSTAAFHARVRGSVPGLGGLKETKMFLPHPRVKVSIVGSLRDREVACSASDRQGSNFESCVWRTVSSQSSHHPQEVLLAQFSLCVHKGGLKPDSFHLQVILYLLSCSILSHFSPEAQGIFYNVIFVLLLLLLLLMLVLLLLLMLLLLLFFMLF